jgi:hypothetical protein
LSVELGACDKSFSARYHDPSARDQQYSNSYDDLLDEINWMASLWRTAADVKLAEFGYGWEREDPSRKLI